MNQGAGAGGARHGAPAAAPRPAGRGVPGRAGALLAYLAIAAAVFAALSAAAVGGLLWAGRRAAQRLAAPLEAPAAPGEAAKSSEEERALRKKFERLVPKGLFIVVDTARNRLQLRDGDKVLREIVVSCGSGSVLEDPKGGRSWVFETPRGERTVKGKSKNPTWIKPDWAFIEEGETIPKKYDDRVEEGVLGNYAFAIGDGYFIHGTLYTRLLGRNVTHGCIRVGDADLEYLYKSVPLGTKVYIY